jgi:amylosucrase
VRSVFRHPGEVRREEGREVQQALLADFGPQARASLGQVDGHMFAARLEQVFHDLHEALADVYGSTDLEPLLRQLLHIALEGAAARPEHLRVRDRARIVDPGWFQRARHVGYCCYVDRFCGTLPALLDHLDYLGELGVTYLHLMPLLRPREGENDGGYAVADYRSIDPRLGSMADLERLASAMHVRGMNLCIDLVLNHTAAEHEWARRAVAGEQEYLDRYITFPDRTLPDQYERSLPDIFPDTAPGNFTWNEQLGRWVWTTFHQWQWDLDYAKPATFVAMFDTIMFLANRGVDVLRLDAAPFIWKQMGTNCQNLPQAHRLLQAFRALIRVAAPGVIFKAEAIVPPNQLVQYLGAHEAYRPECDLAYHNQLMVLLWSSAASRHANKAVTALSRLRPKPASTSWLTYVRCHDDIGWAISDEDAAAVGLNGFAHRRFLADFYAGRFPGSFARGADFQEHPVTGDVRTAGSAAALSGIEQALELGDEKLLNDAVRRHIMLHSVIYSYGGIPLIYMGDELALPNDWSWRADPVTARDSRWMHRPYMNWMAAKRRHDETTIEGQVFNALARFADARRRLVALRGDTESTPLHTDNTHVLAYWRRHARGGRFLALVNFSEHSQSVDAGMLWAAGLRDPVTVLSSDGPVTVSGGRVHLAGLSYAWLVQDD